MQRFCLTRTQPYTCAHTISHQRKALALRGSKEIRPRQWVEESPGCCLLLNTGHAQWLGMEVKMLVVHLDRDAMFGCPVVLILLCHDGPNLP